ncbi:MAG: hypothetical protein K2K55_08765 [Duncaniella sp.]|nr:hypothetical protein [Duncaniella sp.]
MNENIRITDNRAEVVGHPVKIVDTAVMTDGHLLQGGHYSTPEGGHSVISSYRDNLRVSHIAPDGTVAYQRITDVGGTPTGVAAVPGGIIVSQREASPRSFFFDPSSGRFHRTDSLISRPPFTLVAEVKEVLTATAAPFDLANAYTSADRSLRPADLLIASQQFYKLYTDIANRAAASSLHIQPVLACYRLLSASRQVLFTSASVLLSAAEHPQAISTFGGTLIPGRPASVEDLSLSAKAFAVRLVSNGFPDSDYEDVAEVEILLSPQIHPIGQYPDCHSSIVNTGSSIQLLLGIPGLLTAADISRQMTMRLRLLLCRRGMMAMRTVTTTRFSQATGVYAFDSMTPTCSSQISALSGVMKEIDSYLSRLSSDPAFALTQRQMLSLSDPHSFGAECVAVSGDTLLWGGLRALPFRGYTALDLAVGLTDSSAPSGYGGRVSLTGAPSKESSVSMTSRKVARISPLLTYPDGSATQITLIGPDGGLTYSLRPAADGSCAFFLLSAVSIDSSALTEEIPEAVVSGESTDPVSYSSSVALASIDQPLSIKGLLPVSTGPVVAVAPAPRSRGGLEFGRNSFYVFGPGGVDLVRISSGRKSISAISVCRTPVLSQAHVSASDTEVAFLSETLLIRLNSSHVPSLLCAGIEADRLGFDPAKKEYWCSRDARSTLGGSPPASAPRDGDLSQIIGDPCRVTCVPADGGPPWRRTDVNIAELLSTPGALLFAGPDGQLFNASAETHGSQNFRFSRDMRLPPKCRTGLIRVDTGIVGKGLSGTILFSSSPSEDFADPLFAWAGTLNGDIAHSPVPVFPLRHAHHLRLTVAASTTDSSSVRIAT